MIVVKELLAMVVTAAAWGPYWTGWISIPRTYHREIDLSYVTDFFLLLQGFQMA